MQPAPCQKHLLVFIDTEKDHEYEFDNVQKRFIWKLNTLQGGEEASIRVKISLENTPGNHKRELGPVSMSFEVPQFTCSRVAIKDVVVQDQTANQKNPNIFKRFIRTLCKANSYESKIDVSLVQKSQFLL